MVKRVQELGGVVHYVSPTAGESFSARELRKWLGRDDVDAVDRIALPETQTTDEDMAQIAVFRHLEVLNLHGTRVTDAGLVSLRSLSRLEYLGLADTRVTDKGVLELAKALPNCVIDRKGLP